MPYTFYKGALFTNEEYERLKDELDQKEQEYLKLLLGEELESKEDAEEASLKEVPRTSEEPVESVDSQEAHHNAKGSEKDDSGEPEVRRTRRKRQS